MRSFICIFLIIGVLVSCKSTQKVAANSAIEAATEVDNDTVRIASDTVEYEIIIIEPGFNAWLNSIARPEGYYSQQFLENRNRQLVMQWNLRANQGARAFIFPINYDWRIDYGYDVNYKLYNYFVFFQLKNNIQLSTFIPRI